MVYFLNLKAYIINKQLLEITHVLKKPTLCVPQKPKGLFTPHSQYKTYFVNLLP